MQNSMKFVYPSVVREPRFEMFLGFWGEFDWDELFVNQACLVHCCEDISIVARHTGFDSDGAPEVILEGRVRQVVDTEIKHGRTINLHQNQKDIA